MPRQRLLGDQCIGLLRDAAVAVRRWRAGAMHQGAQCLQHDLVGIELVEPAARPLDRRLRHQPRLGIGLVEIFEDDGGVVEHEPAIAQHRHLSLRIECQHLGMLRIVARRLVERHHDPFEGQSLLSQRDLDLAREQAQRPGIQCDHGANSCDGRKPRKPMRQAPSAASRRRIRPAIPRSSQGSR